MFEVVDPGALSTVQDGGRPGHLDLGVPVSGACDTWSLAVANLLLDNLPDAPALEITLAGPVLAVCQTGVIAIAGADLGGEVPEEGRRLAPGSSHRVTAGTHLRFEGVRSGLRAYLALPGGIAAASVLDSASTCLLGGFGGVDGRALRAGGRAPWPRSSTRPGSSRPRATASACASPARPSRRPRRRQTSFLAAWYRAPCNCRPAGRSSCSPMARPWAATRSPVSSPAPTCRASPRLDRARSCAS